MTTGFQATVSQEDKGTVWRKTWYEEQDYPSTLRLCGQLLGEVERTSVPVQKTTYGLHTLVVQARNN